MTYHKKQEILDFIKHFEGATDAFLYGCCYWFAVILQKRFGTADWDDPQPTIMYAEIDNHFGCRIGDAVYDVTGDVTLEYNWKPWITVRASDPLLSQRITRDCILKLT